MTCKNNLHQLNNTQGDKDESSPAVVYPQGSRPDAGVDGVSKIVANPRPDKAGSVTDWYGVSDQSVVGQFGKLKIRGRNQGQ